MDAPPDKEDVAPFVRVAQAMAGLNLNVPIVLARDMPQGFLFLSDLGSRLYLDELKRIDDPEAPQKPEALDRPAALDEPGAKAGVDRLYAEALKALVTLQTAGGAAARELPQYDRALLLREMELLPDWFLSRHLGLPVGDEERRMLDRLFDALVRAALSQPSAFVHRDYHSRNLLVTADNSPGILDFQDAVCGPITYDAVSLLKDCYIAWPVERVLGWVSDYREQLIRAGIAAGDDTAAFVRWFDLMGLQRHIKVLVIFARLYYRDGKPGYLKDLPRVLDYVRLTATMYPETAEFAEFLTRHVDPAFVAVQAELAGVMNRVSA